MYRQLDLALFQRHDGLLSAGIHVEFCAQYGYIDLIGVDHELLIGSRLLLHLEIGLPFQPDLPAVLILIRPLLGDTHRRIGIQDDHGTVGQKDMFDLSVSGSQFGDQRLVRKFLASNHQIPATASNNKVAAAINRPLCVLYALACVPPGGGWQPLPLTNYPFVTPRVSPSS